MKKLVTIKANSIWWLKSTIVDYLNDLNLNPRTLNINLEILTLTLCDDCYRSSSDASAFSSLCLNNNSSSKLC